MLHRVVDTLRSKIRQKSRAEDMSTTLVAMREWVEQRLMARREEVLGEPSIREVEHHQNKRFGLTHTTTEFYEFMCDVDRYWWANFSPTGADSIKAMQGN